MPIIRITIAPDLQLSLNRQPVGPPITVGASRKFIKIHLSEVLPDLMVLNASDLGLDPDTPPEGVLVLNDDFKEFTVNTSAIWIQVQFSEDEPVREERLRIREVFDEILRNWFLNRDLLLDDYTFDLFWGPTNGRGIVNGVPIAW